MSIFSKNSTWTQHMWASIAPCHTNLQNRDIYIYTCHHAHPVYDSLDVTRSTTFGVEKCHASSSRPYHTFPQSRSLFKNHASTSPEHFTATRNGTDMQKYCYGHSVSRSNEVIVHYHLAFPTTCRGVVNHLNRSAVSCTPSTVISPKITVSMIGMSPQINKECFNPFRWYPICPLDTGFSSTPRRKRGIREQSSGKVRFLLIGASALYPIEQGREEFYYIMSFLFQFIHWIPLWTFILTLSRNYDLLIMVQLSI